jgi:hypothetical protein
MHSCTHEGFCAKLALECSFGHVQYATTGLSFGILERNTGKRFFPISDLG